jgi:hypothetical protein
MGIMRRRRRRKFIKYKNIIYNYGTKPIVYTEQILFVSFSSKKKRNRMVEGVGMGGGAPPPE